MPSNARSSTPEPLRLHQRAQQLCHPNPEHWQSQCQGKSPKNTLQHYSRFQNIFLSSSQISPLVPHVKNHEYSDCPCGPTRTVGGGGHRNCSHRRQAAAAPAPGRASLPAERRGRGSAQTASSGNPPESRAAFGLTTTVSLPSPSVAKPAEARGVLQEPCDTHMTRG